MTTLYDILNTTVDIKDEDRRKYTRIQLKSSTNDNYHINFIDPNGKTHGKTYTYTPGKPPNTPVNDTIKTKLYSLIYEGLTSIQEPPNLLKFPDGTFKEFDYISTEDQQNVPPAVIDKYNFTKEGYPTTSSPSLLQIRKIRSNTYIRLIPINSYDKQHYRLFQCTKIGKPFGTYGLLTLENSTDNTKLSTPFLQK